MQNDAMVPIHLTSETGVQQGDPLGPLSFALVLPKALAAIDADNDCLHLILQTSYLDDGVLSGPRSDVRRALSLIKDPGLSLGIIINVAKCKLFNYNDVSMFPPFMVTHLPHLDRRLLTLLVSFANKCACLSSETAF